jgi:ABC-2 type transport system ATP-binding protein
MTGAGLEPPAVTVQRASKHYGDVRAIEDVSLEVAGGDIYALLGLNGAGKTTLIRMLLGMVRPNRGSVEIFGRSSADRDGWSQVGYLVESPSAYPELTVRENLEVTRRLRKVSRPAAVEEAIGLFRLDAYADRRAGTLSLGNVQRLGLAKAMLHRPSLLVLDEPVNGLDPAGVVEVRSLLANLARECGTTVLLSSHILGEVARVATRIGVLHQGRLVDEFDTADLPARVHRHLEVRTRDDSRAREILIGMGLEARSDSGGIGVDGDWVSRNADAVATALVAGGTAPTRLAVVEEDLETYFLRLVGSVKSGQEV